MLMSGNLTVWIFQSTLSVRRATHPLRQLVQIIIISIHALRKESDHRHRLIFGQQVISIHALRKESDLAETSGCSPFPISIHALRKESDDN